jgi:ABC-type multidrug transport system fused ATPase/permease subunit
MQFVTIVLLAIMNLSALYVYFASSWTMADVNRYLWSWLQISFEPSRFTTLAVLLFITAQLLLLIFVYFYGSYNRYLHTKVRTFKEKNKALFMQDSNNKQLLNFQAERLQDATNVEEEASILRQTLEELHTLVSAQEAEIKRLGSQSVGMQRKVDGKTLSQQLEKFKKHLYDFWKK